MSWHFVERWLQKVNQHSTLLGKFWITFLIVFRIVVVSSVGDRVYSDEQSEFKCNTQQVGCPNVCFNQFSPISHIRFWSFQIILVTTPSILFMVYSAHKLKKKSGNKDKDKTPSNGVTPSPTKKAEAAAGTAQGEEDSRKKRRSSGRPTSLLPSKRYLNSNYTVDHRKVRQLAIQELFGEEKAAFTQHFVLYTFSVLIRTALEVAFIWLQYHLFGFRISELYKCTGKPCPNVVDCYVSRPMEKTIFLWFMFAISVLCLAFNLAEFFFLIWQFGCRRKKIERRHKREMRHAALSRSVALKEAEILDGGILSAPDAPPPDYRGVALQKGDAIEIVPVGEGNKTGMAMSFNLEDVIEPRNINYGGAVASTVGSSRSNNFVPPVEVKLVDQPYLANPCTNRQEQNDYYDYV